MAKLKVGIIGLGGIARAHCLAISTLDNVEVVAVADLFEEKRRQYMEKYDIPKGYPSHTELLKDDEVEAVAVVLGHQLHHRLTVDACNAGKHVLVEKPMALSLEQCDDMIEAAANNNVKLMVGQTQHFYGTSLKAKEILDSGQLGPLMTVVCYMSKNWNHASRPPQYRSRFHGGGMWLANGVHVVDRLTWLMASQAVSVSASMGTRAHYQASRRHRHRARSLQERPRRRRRLGRFRRRRAQLREPGHLRQRHPALQPAWREVCQGRAGGRVEGYSIRRPVGRDAP